MLEITWTDEDGHRWRVTDIVAETRKGRRVPQPVELPLRLRSSAPSESPHGIPIVRQRAKPLRRAGVFQVLAPRGNYALPHSR